MRASPTFSANIAASYVSQIYVTAVGIVTVPLYLSYMSPEAYGLVGFFVMIQGWFGLLDMGLSPTMARETARYRGGALSTLEFRRLVRLLQLLFLLLAGIGGVVLFASAGIIARDWLKPGELPQDEVLYALRVMAAAVALRWMVGLYRGAITGAERMIWLGNFTAFAATLRFVGVIPVLMFVGATPSIFFTFQLLVSAIELGGMVLKAYSLFPAVPVGERLGWSLRAAGPAFRFALVIAGTAVIAALVTQTDRLVLSTVLPLAEYGYFSLAVLVAGGVLVISGPVGTVIMPRMARLEAEGDHAGLIRVYRGSTQLVAVIASAASLTLAFCAEPLLWAWTGSQTVADYAAPLVVLYALGNGIFAVSAFPYYLQYAKGNLRLHFIGNIGFAMFMAPTMIWAASHYGAIGAAIVWLIVNMISFFAWLPLVHARFEPGLNRKWYLNDVLVIYFAAAATGAVAQEILPRTDDRLWQFGAIALFGFTLLTAAALASSQGRARLMGLLRTRAAGNGAAE